MRAPASSTVPNLQAFCAAFELGSFSRAARRLGVTPQAASRGVARLEDSLGARLFRRTTRSLTPTDAARAYYASAHQALALLDQAEHDLRRGDARPHGRVRLSAPTSFGHHRLLPAVAALRERHPTIELELHVGNRNVELTREGYDLAIRMGAIRAPGLVARKLGDFSLGVFAAPSYLARHPAPRAPAQLDGHACVGFVMPTTGRLLPWTFSPGPRAFTPRAAVRCADDVLALITLARGGLGLIQTYDFLVEHEVARGQLVEVLRDFRGATRPFSLIYPATPRPTPAARAVIEFLLERR